MGTRPQSPTPPVPIGHSTRRRAATLVCRARRAGHIVAMIAAAPHSGTNSRSHGVIGPAPTPSPLADRRQTALPTTTPTGSRRGPSSPPTALPPDTGSGEAKEGTTPTGFEPNQGDRLHTLDHRLFGRPCPGPAIDATPAREPLLFSSVLEQPSALGPSDPGRHPADAGRRADGQISHCVERVRSALSPSPTFAVHCRGQPLRGHLPAGRTQRASLPAPGRT
jgi:hypothetical protein